jgi:uncharacterized membrane protein YkoI
MPPLTLRHVLTGKLLLGPLLALALLIPTPASADDDEAHPQIDAAEVAAARPLTEVIQRITDDYGGSLLAIDLEKEMIDGASVLVYEAKVLTPKGHMLILDYDARSLDLLRQRGIDDEGHAGRGPRHGLGHGRGQGGGHGWGRGRGREND